MKIQFVIMSENFTYELECPVSGSKVAAAQAGATWGETKAALEAELSIKAAHVTHVHYIL